MHCQFPPVQLQEVKLGPPPPQRHKQLLAAPEHGSPHCVSLASGHIAPLQLSVVVQVQIRLTQLQLPSTQLVHRQIGGHLEQERASVIQVLRLVQSVQPDKGLLGQFRRILRAVELARQVLLERHTVLGYQVGDELVFVAGHVGIMPPGRGQWPAPGRA